MRNKPSRSRGLLGILTALLLVVGVPLTLMSLARRRFGSSSPLDGMKAPWHWTSDGLRTWADSLRQGSRTSTQLVDVFLRVGLTIAWLCLVILLMSTVAEVLFQVRNGMPSHRRRAIGGLGTAGRRLATLLIAIVPLVTAVSPTLVQASASASDPVPASRLMAAQTVNTAAEAGRNSTVTVRPGDSVWAIAERVADGSEIGNVANEIVELNLGQVMNDGRTFTTPALILPGWQLQIPSSSRVDAASGTSIPAQPPTVAESVDARQSYVVQAGDSFWGIAEHQLPSDSLPTDIAELTEIGRAHV